MRDDPPKYWSRSPPPETGRNPEAVTTDFIGGVVAIPGIILGGVVLFVLSVVLRNAFLKPPAVPTSEALSALVRIEDDFYASGPSMGLRERITTWFQWAELDRRIAFELDGVPYGPLRTKAEDRGREALEDIASIVEYSGNAAQGIGDRFETGRFADKMAARQAQSGRVEQDQFARRALSAGRQALSDAVRSIDDARAAADDSRAKASE